MPQSRANPDGQLERVELRLECHDCEETHSHIFYAPVSAGTVDVECPRCGYRGDHDVVGRT